MPDTSGMVMIYIAAVAVITVIGIFVSLSQKKKQANIAELYLENYPDSAKLMISNKGFVVSKSISVISVNGETPAYFTEKTTPGVYIRPGTSTLVVDFSSTRPGVLHKSVTKSTGAVTIEVELAPRGEYTLSFDEKNREFRVDSNN